MTNEHSTPALPESTVEITLAAYGQMLESVQMSRETAVMYAQQMIGRLLTYPKGYQLNIANWTGPAFKIISTRLEDDTPGDPSKGRVVAICQPLPNRQMEVK